MKSRRAGYCCVGELRKTDAALWTAHRPTRVKQKEDIENDHEN